MGSYKHEHTTTHVKRLLEIKNKKTLTWSGGNHTHRRLNFDSLVKNNLKCCVLAVLEKDPRGSKVLDRYIWYQLQK